MKKISITVPDKYNWQVIQTWGAIIVFADKPFWNWKEKRWEYQLNQLTVVNLGESVNEFVSRSSLRAI